MISETVCVWSDGTWCYLEDLEDYLTFMSDDYFLMNVTIDFE